MDMRVLICVMRMHSHISLPLINLKYTIHHRITTKIAGALELNKPGFNIGILRLGFLLSLLFVIFLDSLSPTPATTGNHSLVFVPIVSPFPECYIHGSI